MLPPETAHNLSIWALKSNIVPAQNIFISQKLQSEVLGLTFQNPVGLAAGFDKNAKCIESLANQNFGFLELGTVTPMPQKGNPKPRIFRINEHNAIINRMGFPNHGLESFSQNLRSWKYSNYTNNKVIIGANIGKNKTTKDAVEDYIKCFEKVYALSDYITVNISSPNTPGLRNLQEKENLRALLAALQEKRKEIKTNYIGEIPIVVKISPDEDEESLKDIAEVLVEQEIDGVIISNTSINQGLIDEVTDSNRSQTGGLSGSPIFELSTQAVSIFYKKTQGKIPIIAAGGVSSAEEAYEKIKSGASLVQIYSGLIFKGFELVNQINKGLVKLLTADGFENISQAIGAHYKKTEKKAEEKEDIKREAAK